LKLRNIDLPYQKLLNLNDLYQLGQFFLQIGICLMVKFTVESQKYMENVNIYRQNNEFSKKTCLILIKSNLSYQNLLNFNDLYQLEQVFSKLALVWWSNLL